MEKVEFEKSLLISIKEDDEKSFSFLMQTNSDLNLCFGRFPILSLLYLYSSFKILAKYEKKLLSIHNFKLTNEPLWIYADFKTIAKRSLRFFQGDEIVYPILMLAVLDEKLILDKYYKFLFKDVEIIEKLQKIYILNHNSAVVVMDDSVRLPQERLRKKHYILAGFLSALICFFITMTSILISVIPVKNGLGTIDKPIKIASASELRLALEDSNRNYILTNDIVIAEGLSFAEDFSGMLDGAGKTIVIEGDISSSLILNLFGIIKNLNIKLTNNKIKITQNSAVIVQKNSGIIENCLIFGNFNQECNAEDEVFVGLFAAENTGTISNCKTQVSGVMSNKKDSNSFFGLFVGQNLAGGKITNCLTESGIVIADTVDIAGIAGYNYGEISQTENRAKLSQTSEKSWNPNVAGITISNFGEINDCKNSAELSSSSSVVEIDVSLEVVLGGVACENYGNIINCSNLGELSGTGDVLNVIVGGITARNIKTSDFEGLVKYSLANAKITALADEGKVCVAGVVAFNNSVILNSGYIGLIKADSNSIKNEAIYMDEVDKAVAVVSGGVVAVNKEAPVQNSFADVSYECGADVENVLKIYSGVIGTIGLYKYSFASNPSLIFNYRNAYLYIGNNFYVDKPEIKQPAYGVYGSLDDEGYYKGGVAEAIPNEGSESLMKKCATFDEIPEGVRKSA